MESLSLGVKWARDVVSGLPKNEFDLKDNISRAARSTTRNIAEGFSCFHYQENIQFCRILRSSLFEIIDDVITLKEERYITEEKYYEGRNKIDYALKVLNGYVLYLQKQKNIVPNRRHPNNVVIQ